MTWFLCAALLVCSAPVSPVEQARPLEFRLSFTETVSRQPFTGRVFVMLTRNERPTPPEMPNWLRPEPLFARDVKDWKPGETLVIDRACLAHPTPLDKLQPGTYSVFAVMDFERGMSFSGSEGNGYSKPLRRPLDPAATGPLSLTIDQVYKERRFEETDRVKLAEIDSRLLTAFHGRPTKLRAGVILPKSWQDDPTRRYPVVYEVPGFSGNHFMAHAIAKRNPTDVAGVEMLWVVLDPNCRLGHHVFADSANNGPCGRALIEELIPHIEKTFRGWGSPAGRFVTGHSSGGWSSLWLQVAYPDFFGGCWSTSPDPVDFRDFQKIDLTSAASNMFRDADGKDRPIARSGGKPSIYYKPFSDMEVVMGHGGQLASFEAVFSPRGPDGKPRQLWDRVTGHIDLEVARSWEKYDIRLVLERNWDTLGPKLAGKLHVWMGEEDTFYLEGAVKLLKVSLARLGSDAVVELFPGKTHALVDAKLRERMNREMAEQFRRLTGLGARP